MQSALIVVTNVKFRSSRIQADLFIVEIVGQNEEEREDSVTKRHHEPIGSTSFFVSTF